MQFAVELREVHALLLPSALRDVGDVQPRDVAAVGEGIDPPLVVDRDRLGDELALDGGRILDKRGPVLLRHEAEGALGGAHQHAVAVAHRLLRGGELDVLALVLAEDDGDSRGVHRLLDGEDLLFDDVVLPARRGKDGAEVGDALLKLGKFLFKPAHLEMGERFQAHIHDRLSLIVREVEALAQREFRLGSGLRGLDDPDHFVDVADGDEQAPHDLRTLFRRFEVEGRPAHDDVALIGDVIGEDGFQPHLLRLAARDGDHIDGIAHFEIGLLHEEGDDLARVRLAFQFDDGAHARLVGLVQDLAYAAEELLILLPERGDVLQHVRLGDLIRHLGDDDVLFAPVVLDVQPRAQLEPALARLVDALHAVHGDDEAARGEIGTVYDFEELRRRYLRVVDDRDHGVYRLPHIVGRDVGGKPDRDAARSVDEQVGEPAGEHIGLLHAVVEVGAPGDGVLVEIAEKLQRERAHPRLGISHCGGRIAVGGAEVAVPVHELHAH